MKKRRRRWFREETIAPWLTLFVILALWWGASSVMRPSVPESASSPTAAEDPSPEARVPQETASESHGDSKPDMVPTPPEDVARVGIAAPEGDRAVVPVAGVDVASLQSTFDQARGGGSRRHEAMDILAPRGTPVVAAVEGRVVKLFTSAAGGLTVYQFDEDERYCYYYAHLDAYAPDLTEGQVLKRGQVIGTVGTTGNAPPDTPHLHFAIFRLGAEKKWWEGEPLDPITFLR